MEDTRTLVHRIRNDLQLVSSIIHAEMSEAVTQEARAALAAMDRRMLAINLSYTGEETARVHLPRYLADLCTALEQKLDACPDTHVGSASARRIGMIAAEALGAANRPAALSVMSTDRTLTVSVTREKATEARGAETEDAWMTGVCRELVLDLLQQLGGRVLADGPSLLTFEIVEA